MVTCMSTPLMLEQQCQQRRTGIAGEALTGNERLIYSTDEGEWGVIRDFGVPEAPADSQLYARKDQADGEAFTIPVDPVQSDWDVNGRFSQPGVY